jgi:hypothetical protein
MGLITMATGLVYAVKIFTLILGALKSPEGVQVLIAQWAVALGGDQLNIALTDSTLPGAKLLAVSSLGMLVAILSWISVALITTGGKILSWTLGDKEAIRKILAYAFGPARKPAMRRPEGDRPSDPHSNPLA